MNISSSKFSSGCESGWTVYFEQSYEKSEFQRDQRHISYQEEEGEDMSMVSDASSGPPNCHEEDDDREECLSSASKYSVKNKERDEISSKKRSNYKRNIAKCKSDDHYQSCLDDTASSPLSKNKSTLSRKEAYSQDGFSTTQFQGECAFEKHFGMFESSLAKASPSQKPGEFQGGNWE